MSRVIWEPGMEAMGGQCPALPSGHEQSCPARWGRPPPSSDGSAREQAGAWSRLVRRAERREGGVGPPWGHLDRWRCVWGCGLLACSADQGWGGGRESQAEGFAGGTFHPSTSEMPKGFSVFSSVVIGWQSWKWGPAQGPAAGVQAPVGAGRTSIVQWLGHGGKEEGKADRLEARWDLGSEGWRKWRWLRAWVFQLRRTVRPPLGLYSASWVTKCYVYMSSLDGPQTPVRQKGRISCSLLKI